MARALRIECGGAPFNVPARGDRRKDIYHDEDDRLTWLDVFSQVCARFNWRCHAWCLVDNHILIETTEGNLAQGVRQFNGVYTQKNNRERDVPVTAPERHRGILPGACIVSLAN